AVSGADPEIFGAEPQAGDPQGRCAKPNQPAFGLSFPYALPLRARALPRGSADPARGHAGTRRRLPPARRRGQTSFGETGGSLNALHRVSQPRVEDIANAVPK